MTTQRRSSGVEAYDLLLDAIEKGGLPAGARLREAELAQRFKISRTPIREALKRLEAEGLITHEPHRGATVATLDYAQIVELYQLREVLEGTSASLAAVHATQAEIDHLWELIARDRLIITRTEDLAQTNRIFHQQIILSARNEFLGSTLGHMRLALALLPGTTLGAPGRAQQSVDEHEAIVERIAARDPDGADDAARSHIRNAFKTRIKQLRADITARL